MALKASGDYRFELDGQYICFRLFDPDGAFVNCSVSVDYLFLRGAADGFRDQNCRALFLLYRRDIERLASELFDGGAERPLITPSYISDDCFDSNKI
jgi:uncharacterized protein DUF1488